MPTSTGDPPLYFRHHVFVCCNRRPDGHQRGSCAAKGSERLRDYMKARCKEMAIAETRINTSLCLDRCEHGPCVVIYPEGVWYRFENEADVDAIIQKHLLDGGRAATLMIDNDRG